MARFLVIHRVSSSEISQDELFKRARGVITSLPPETKWLNSWWVAGESPMLFCEWEAPDADVVRASVGQVEDVFPIQSLQEVEWIDPEWYQSR
jgi:hypothetical protein